MNINGTYRSQNNEFVLTITNSNEENGTFTGSYVSTHTPQGQQTFSVLAGVWQYVNNPGGSLTPLNIGFIAACRPEARPFTIFDSWSGVLTKAGTFTATGTRSSLATGGAPGLSSLGTQVFGS
jgi:hypothetical protein